MIQSNIRRLTNRFRRTTYPPAAELNRWADAAHGRRAAGGAGGWILIIANEHLDAFERQPESFRRHDIDNRAHVAMLRKVKS